MIATIQASTLSTTTAKARRREGKQKALVKVTTAAKGAKGRSEEQAKSAVDARGILVE